MMKRMSKPLPTKKRATAGTRDLTAAVDEVHKPRKPRVKRDDLMTPEQAARQLAKVSDDMLLAAGDMPDRETFFDLDDSEEPRKRAGRKVHIVMERGAALPDYRSRDGKRTHRSMITIPPKLRESIEKAFGVAEGEDFPVTTALIALADYGAMVLKRDSKMLRVSSADDEDAAQRKEVRTLIRMVGLKK